MSMYYKDIYFVGDIHGEFEWLHSWIKNSGIEDSLIIQIGDFGIGFPGLKMREDSWLSRINALCSLQKVKILVVRGNHDNPEYFTKDFFHPYKNIEFLTDYTYRTINDKNFLFIGGAISIDRSMRDLGINYWQDEKFSLDLQKIDRQKKSIPEIHTVVTHTAPESAPPRGINNIVKAFAWRNHTLISDLEKERQDLEKLKNHIRNRGVEEWYYGHFHVSANENIHGINFRCLDIEEVHKWI